jgi:hypothetical protein
MPTTLEVYRRIVREIPPRWFDPAKLEQPPDVESNPAAKANKSIVATILWGAATVIKRVHDVTDAFFVKVSRSQATGADEDLHYTTIYDIKRRTNESDANYRARVGAELFAGKKTREAIIAAVESFLGEPPIDVIEGAMNSFFLDVSFLDTHQMTRAGRGDMLVIVAGPLTVERREELIKLLRRVMPGINLILEIKV